MSDNPRSPYPDVARLLGMARRLEREGKKETAALIYTAASEIARMRAELRPSNPGDGRE